MKKKLFLSLLLALALLLSLGATASTEARLDFVTDEAGILSGDTAQSLSEKARQISDEYDCGVYIVVVNDYFKYVGGGGIESFAEEVFANYDLGYGDTRDGVILAMSMDQRDYDIYAHGDFGNYAFTDYGKQQLAERVVDNFRENDWAGGVRDFITKSEDLIRNARNGNSVDIWIPDAEPEPPLTSGEVLTSLFISVIVSGITVGSFKKQMKTAVRQTRAANYVSQGGVKLRRQDDQLVNRTVSQQVIRHDPSGNRPGGGHFGGTTISGSHGGSHHSGKF